MAANWGAILAGLGGGAGSLGQSMDENEKEATRKAEAERAFKRLLAQDAMSEQESLNKMGAEEDTGLPSSADFGEMPTPGSIFSGGGPIAALADASRNYEASPKFQLPTAQGGTRKLRINEERTPEAIAFRRLLQTQSGAKDIAQLQAEAAGSRASEALAGRFGLAGVNNTAAQQRANTLANSQRGMVAGTVNTVENGQPVVTAYTRGGETKTLGQAVPSTTVSRGAQAAKSKMAEMDAGEVMIDHADKLVADNPDVFGIKNYAPGFVRERLPDGERAAGPLAALEAVVGELRHERFGGAITAIEAEKAIRIFSDPTSPPAVIRAKLAEMRLLVSTRKKSMGRYLGADQPASTQSASTTPTRQQQLWDAAVAKHGQDKVLAEVGPRP